MRGLSLLCVAAQVLLPAIAPAATTRSATMNASMTIPATCTMSMPTTLDFGTATATTSGAISAMTVNFAITTICTNGTKFDAYFTSPNLSGGTWYMKSGSNQIPYGVYWMNNCGGGGVRTSADGPFNTSDGTQITRWNPSICVSAQTAPAPGNYSDTITTAVNY
ncbi:spore coat protein U domain-containing protein [Sphingomonas sp.]|jgi:spore coat protein U-like protein|uniref:spore coat protein U domain-containing protein n=1 Tax=Sphingomonas sp. TaxID=28214 RepID=UPI0035C7CE54